MNTEREVIEKIKSILEEIGIEYSNILLFGSRTGKDLANTISNEVYLEGVKV